MKIDPNFVDYSLKSSVNYSEGEKYSRQQRIHTNGPLTGISSGHEGGIKFSVKSEKANRSVILFAQKEIWDTK